MKTIPFHKNKYGIELLMDLGTYASIPHYFFEAEVHCTDFYEIIFFERIEGKAIINQQELVLSPNTILFISPYQKRQWFVNKETLEAYFLIFQEDFLNTFFSDKLFVYRLQYFFNYDGKLLMPMDAEFNAHLKGIFGEILAEIRGYQSDSAHVIRSLLYFILAKLNRAFAKFHALSAETQLNNIAYQFKSALEANLPALQKVDEYAQLIGTSRISLNTATKKQFNLTASAMIKSRLLTEIKDQLLYTASSIAEIAYNLHFSEPANFNRFFKQQTGSTPAEFRRRYQNDNSSL